MDENEAVQNKKEITKIKRPPRVDKEVHQKLFLKAFKKSCSITAACEAVGISRDLHYQWLDCDPTYPKRFAAAKKIGIEWLEEVAVKRASEGWLEPVFYKGKESGHVRKYSDTLLIFMLKGAKPNKYRERVDTHVSGNVGLIIEINTDGDGIQKKDSDKKLDDTNNKLDNTNNKLE